MKRYYTILNFLFLFYLIMACTTSKKDKNILWISSNQSAQWQLDTIKNINTDEIHETAIKIFSDTVYQVIDGFGGCFNELGWEALNQVPDHNQQEILNAIFDTVHGCKFNICRMPLGANDYSVNWYSHNETDKDFQMEKFSIKRDTERLLPYIQKARAISPDIKIWASPWCPPSWMKTNNHYACRPDVVNDLTEEGQGEEMVTQFIMQDNYLNAYALYFSKFIQAYKKHGIDIYAVHVQNEPNSCQNFPSCIWEPTDLSLFIGKFLGPRFHKDNLKTQIWLGTIERPQIKRVSDVIENNEAGKYITGVGFQWAGKGAIPEVNKKYPDLKLMQTETECGNGSNNWEAAEYTFGLMKHYFKHGANSYLYWNMILDETGKSQWGWKQNSMITIDKKQKTISYNPEFFLMKHFSAFVEKGSNYIKTNDDNCLAFKRDNRLVIIYYHAQNDTMEKEFIVNESLFRAEITPRSFNTFVLDI